MSDRTDERSECLKIVAVIKILVDHAGKEIMGRKVQPLTASEALTKVIEAIQRRTQE